jgi:hypothetical protein
MRVWGCLEVKSNDKELRIFQLAAPKKIGKYELPLCEHSQAFEHAFDLSAFRKDQLSKSGDYTHREVADPGQ